MELGRIGIWSFQLRAREGVREAAAELDELGYGTLWILNGPAMCGRGNCSTRRAESWTC